MPKLRCGADNCLFNQERYCMRNRIHVQGCRAVHEDETQCGSFRYCENDEQLRVEFAYLNAENENVSINCDCTNCRYNDKELCVNDFVKISGHGTMHRVGTACESFEKKEND